MEFKEFAAILDRACAQREVLVAFLNCEVTYSGRAEAYLPRGDRLFVLKADGTVLLHQPQGSQPINYMKTGCSIRTEFADDTHIVVHVTEGEQSFLHVQVYDIHSCMSRKLEDGQRQDLAGSERDMSDWIRDNPTSISKDFRPTAREQHTDVGFIDVYGHDGQGRIVVIECKRITASLTAVDQLRRYVERVKLIKGVDIVKGVLAAPAITPNAQEMLASWGFAFAKVQPPKRLQRWHAGQKGLLEF